MRLDDNLTSRVLNLLGLQRQPPELPYLDALLAAYVRRVPWESAFRIAKRGSCQLPADCARWPDQFWNDAIERGGGGTCFESNYAFFALLQALGYQGYLTLNDMEETVACHTAIVVLLKGERWLVDVGMPFHVAVPLADGPTERASPLHTYIATPEGNNRYTMTRTPHPSPYAFTLVDKPVDDASYRAALAADYGPGGYFLDRVVINKVIDDQIWRYNSAEPPAHLQQFVGSERQDWLIEGAVSERLAAHFDIDRDTVQAAFDALKRRARADS